MSMWPLKRSPFKIYKGFPCGQIFDLFWTYKETYFSIQGSKFLYIYVVIILCPHSFFAFKICPYGGKLKYHKICISD